MGDGGYLCAGKLGKEAKKDDKRPCGILKTKREIKNEIFVHLQDEKRGKKVRECVRVPADGCGEGLGHVTLKIK